MILRWGSWSRMGKETAVYGLSSLASARSEAVSPLDLRDTLELAFSSSQLFRLYSYLQFQALNLSASGWEEKIKLWATSDKRPKTKNVDMLNIVPTESLRAVKYAYIILVEAVLRWAILEPEMKEKPVILILPLFNTLIFCSSWNFGWILIF